jgi:hypothetical protein
LMLVASHHIAPFASSCASTDEFDEVGGEPVAPSSCFV